MIHRNFKEIHKKFRRESKSISAVFVILKLPLQKLNGTSTSPASAAKLESKTKKSEMVAVEDVGMYHYQMSEKKARNVCWPKHEGDVDECCTEFYKAKQVTGRWTLVSRTTYFLENEKTFPVCMMHCSLIHIIIQCML